MSEIEMLSEVAKLREYLQNLVDDNSNDIKIRKIVSDYIYTLLYKYADYGLFPKFNENAFLKVFSWLEDYMYGEIEYKHYAPLYRFNMPTNKIKLPDNFLIIKVRPEELVEILKSGSLRHEVFFLTHVIHFTSKTSNYEEKKQTLDDIITALRLFKAGRVGYNTIYSHPALTEALGSSHSSTNRILLGDIDYTLNNNEVSQFRILCENFLRYSSKRIKQQKFMSIAIDRFNLALEERDEEDRIINLSIALEALFSTGSEDLTYKLRLRISVLVGQDDNESNFLFDFINKAYEIRSKLVHGKINKDSFKKFDIETKTFPNLYSVANESRKDNESIYNQIFESYF